MDIEAVFRHASAAQDGEEYSETVSFNHDDEGYSYSFVSPDRQILSDELVDKLFEGLDYFAQLTEGLYTHVTTLPSRATLMDITATKIEDINEYLQDYKCAALFKPQKSVIAIDVPTILQNTILRKALGLREPYYERTREHIVEHSTWKDENDKYSFFDNVILSHFHLGLCESFSHAFSDVLSSSITPITLKQVKGVFQERKKSVHYKFRFELWYDEEYKFQYGRTFTSFAGRIEVLLDGTFIDALVASSSTHKHLEGFNTPIELMSMVSTYDRGPLQEELLKSSPYVMMAILMLFDDYVIRILLEDIKVNKKLKLAIEIMSKNLDDDMFINIDETMLIQHATVLWSSLYHLYDIECQPLKSLPYDQTVRVSNILLILQKK